MKTFNPWVCRVWLCGLVLALAGGMARAQDAADADPPGRIARLSAQSGGVWRFDDEKGQWVDVSRNRPLTSGDRLSTGADGSALLRIGSTAVRLAADTDIELLRVEDERVQLWLQRGSMAVTLLSAESAAQTQLVTDDVWLQPRRDGLFRIDRDDQATWAGSWRGELGVVDDATLVISAGQRLRLWRDGANDSNGPDRPLRHTWHGLRDDAFAARVLHEDRLDREAEGGPSARLVSHEMTGAEDLDGHGRWGDHPDYGAIWLPTAVGPDWAPYRDGHWTWIAPWGWTWVGDEPWGFAPFHYGRWIHWQGRWAWVPGPYAARPVFAPGLVGWIGGAGLSLAGGGPAVGWVPLAPWEAYAPSYRVSPGYRERIDPRPPRPVRPLPGQGGGWANRFAPGAVTTGSAERWRRAPATPPERPPQPTARPDPAPKKTIQPVRPPQSVQSVRPAQPPQPARPDAPRPAPRGEAPRGQPPAVHPLPHTPPSAQRPAPADARPPRPDAQPAPPKAQPGPRPGEPRSAEPPRSSETRPQPPPQAKPQPRPAEPARPAPAPGQDDDKRKSPNPPRQATR
jgi:hypothetical protein